MTTAGSPVKTNGKLHELESHLRQRIRGQDQVLPRIVSLLQRGELGLTKPGRPRGSFLFLGPTGVGKTEVTLTFTGFLMSKEHLFRFDMSEYQTQESLGLLLGGKLGERGTLGMVYDRSKIGTLLFDEIEKAHPRVLDVFLQILGRRARDVGQRRDSGVERLLRRVHVKHRQRRPDEPAILNARHDGAPRPDARTTINAP